MKSVYMYGVIVGVFVLIYATMTLGPFFTTIAEQDISSDTINVYFFGASTMWGEPYGEDITIPDLIRRYCGGSLDNKRIRCINLSKRGKDSAYVKKMVSMVLFFKMITKPSVLIVYYGHNEFLKYQDPWKNFFANEFTRFIRYLQSKFPVLYDRHLMRGESDAARELFDEPVIALDEYSEVIEQYKRTFRFIGAMARKHKVPLIVSTVVANYAEWDPNRSVYSGDPADRDEFKKCILDALLSENQENYNKSIQLLSLANEYDATFAEVHYRLGRLYRKIGKYELSRREFMLAVKYDRMPLRVLPEQNEFLRTLDDMPWIYVADSEERVYEVVPDGLIGNNVMTDAHHPNMIGFQCIAQTIYEKLGAIYPTSNRGMNLSYIDLYLPANAMYDVLISRGKWVLAISTWRYDPHQRYMRAEECFQQALDLNPDRYEAYLGLALLNYFRQERVVAEDYMAVAKTLAADRVGNVLNNVWLKKWVPELKDVR